MMLRKRNIKIEESHFLDERSPDYIKEHTIQKKFIIYQKLNGNSCEESSNSDNQKPQKNNCIHMAPHKNPQNIHESKPNSFIDQIHQQESNS